MLVVMKANATPEMIASVVREVETLDLHAHPIPGAVRTAIGITGNKTQVAADRLLALDGVEEIIHVTAPYKLVGRDFHPEDTIVDVDGERIGGKKLAFIGGPCSVEGLEQTLQIAAVVKAAGARFFRGGAFKPRTSPYAFQGLGLRGLEILAEVRKVTDLRIVTEAIDPETLKQVAKYADVVQIGARNMQNYSLLREVGKLGMPVLLKRGMSSTIEEFLMAAEYILAEGNSRVILCERGVRTFVDHTRNTLDLSAIPFVKAKSHLPIIVDPSHGTGVSAMVPALSRAAIAVGADGLIVEAHTHPDKALSDGYQTVTPETFARIVHLIGCTRRLTRESLPRSASPGCAAR